jgi:DNA-binding SARP family transcriptional activator/TolB-like protein/Tfp pilus assembly protein PilF
MLRLRAFGGCAVWRGNERADEWASQPRALALLALLAGSPDGLSRPTVCALLWPESDETRARDSLRQLVLGIRRRSGQPELLTGTTTLHLDRRLVSSDIDDFLVAEASGDDVALATLHGGPFLEGFALREADDFDRWAERTRARCTQVLGGALARLASAATARGDGRAAVERWRQLAAIDPTATNATIGLMRALVAVGEGATAVRQSEIHAALLQESLGLPADPAVLALAEQIRSSAKGRVDQPPQVQIAPAVDAKPRRVVQPPRVPPGQHGRQWLMPGTAIAAMILLGVAMVTRPVGPRAPSPVASDTSLILIAPFARSSTDTADAAMVEGLTDELITALARSSTLRVIGRTSAFLAGARGDSLPRVARALGASQLLDGSWRRTGSAVRLHVRLLSVADGAVTWAMAIDDPVAMRPSQQAALALSIADSIRLRVPNRPTGTATAKPSPTSDAVADLVLRGRHAFHHRIDSAGVARAAQYFAAAVTRDSMYAPGYSGLADALTRLAVFGYATPRPALDHAERAAVRAVALAPQSPEALVALAHVRMVSAYDWSGAEAGFRRALAVAPHYAFGRAPYSILLMSRGRFAEALAHLDSAAAIEPLAPWVANLRGRVLVAAGRASAAVDVFRSILELYPELDLAQQQLGYAWMQLRQPDSALSNLAASARRHGVRDSLHLAYALAVLGRRSDADAIVAAAERRPTVALLHAVPLATVYAALGKPDRAFDWLERGYAARSTTLIGVGVDPGLRALHADRRWSRLMAAMGLPLVDAASALRQREEMLLATP